MDLGWLPTTPRRLVPPCVSLHNPNQPATFADSGRDCGGRAPWTLVGYPPHPGCLLPRAFLFTTSTNGQHSQIWGMLAGAGRRGPWLATHHTQAACAPHGPPMALRWGRGAITPRICGVVMPRAAGN